MDLFFLLSAFLHVSVVGTDNFFLTGILKGYIRDMLEKYTCEYTGVYSSSAVTTGADLKRQSSLELFFVYFGYKEFSVRNIIPYDILGDLLHAYKYLIVVLELLVLEMQGGICLSATGKKIIKLYYRNLRYFTLNYCQECPQINKDVIF